jgi:sulfur carrier protein
MELIINHTRKTFDILPENLEALLAIELPGKRKGIAVALNNRIIPLSAWAETLPQPQRFSFNHYCHSGRIILIFNTNIYGSLHYMFAISELKENLC